MKQESRLKSKSLSRLLAKDKKSIICIDHSDYQLGDTLEVFNTTKNVKPGDPDCFFYFKVTHIQSGFGLKENYVCLSVEQIDEKEYENEEN